MRQTGKEYVFVCDERMVGGDTTVKGVCKISDHGDGPYLSCTYEERICGRLASCGALSVTYLHAIGRSDLTRLVRWHLCNIDTGPMHYVENAVYWAKKMAGCSKWAPRPTDADPVAAFRDTVIFGALPGDIMPLLGALPDEDLGDLDAPSVLKLTQTHVRKVVQDWCMARYTRLMQQCEYDLRLYDLVD